MRTQSRRRARERMTHQCASVPLRPVAKHLKIERGFLHDRAGERDLVGIVGHQIRDCVVLNVPVLPYCDEGDRRQIWERDRGAKRR